MSGQAWVPGPGRREAVPPARFDPARLAEPVRSLRAHRRAADAASSPGADAAPVGGALATDVREAVAGAAGLHLGSDDLRVAVDGVRDHVWGLGPLGVLVADPAVTDVLVNGGGAVWVDRGRGPEPEVLRLGGEPEVRALAVRLATLAGRRLDDAMPWVDARLPGGVRLHAVVPPLAPEGTHVSLRVLRPVGFDLDALVARGALPAAWAAVLEALVRRRAAFLVSGGTGAGKTTLLAALLGLVPPAERILLVEDVGELRPDHPHVVRLEARHANVEGRGEVGLDQLVRQALRMRPDRIVVGECRGPEVRELLAALNTGHAGGCGTVHANACAEVPARLEALGSLAGMSPRALAGQVAAAIDVVVHVERHAGLRRVAEVAVVSGDARAGLVVEPALTRSGDGSPVPGPAWPGLATALRLSPGAVGGAP
ncbi:TadA family conjugal transfer-associated ATPase [Kineosporia sp. A_224]|uniref:TadA family conjugal transfer-associated ATPase n=1 Tax=Kineosporia sp. A_224 TaxID=1962180 RepID=UPI001E6327B4|nr:TadA family conjugal transfer-associated ATPase [Kineosporia sp. A_224]